MLVKKLALALGLLLVSALPGRAADDWDTVSDKAVAFLKKTQNADGSWGTAPRNRGVTGIVVTGLLQSGKLKTDDATIEKSLKFIVSLVNEKDGHIAGADATDSLKNYVTSINVMALVAANKPDQYKKIVGDASKFLQKLQWDDSEGKKEDDDFFGGAGYDSKSRPDLSNSQYFVEALRAAGVPADDPSLKKALVFVSRCQNFKSEANKLPWAGKINDGSFIYSAAGGGSTKTSDEANAPLTGYGSMTYAGIKSMIYCGVGKDDERYKMAYEWITKNYTVEGNPGMPKELAGRGLYYYYNTMAKTLTLMNIDEVVDADGKKHNWRKDLFEAIQKRQKEDGSWTNPTDRWMEGDPALVSGYVLMSLSYIKPKK